MIVGASDRMLSAPDIKFEPPQLKIFQFTAGVVALVAGDPYAQMSICYEVTRALKLRALQNRPDETVLGIASLYAEAFSKQRRDIAETKYLKPLGLDVGEFLTRHSEFSGGLVSDLASDMRHLSLDAEAIIAGHDVSGHHIYVVEDPGTLKCADAVAFAAIGSGKSHADSQFMMARHTKDTPFHTALLQAYAAKKRAEVSPTVGTETDLFYISGKDGFQRIHPRLFTAINQVYETLELNIDEAQQQADQEARHFLERHIEGDTGQAPPTEIDNPPEPTESRKPGERKRRDRRTKK